MTITVFRKRGPQVSDGYQITRCTSPRMALDHVNRDFWPAQWKEDVAQKLSPVFGTDPITTLNATFNKNGYWFLDYWDNNWLRFTNENIAQVLREHFEGESSCEADIDDCEVPTRDTPRPYRVAITSMADETNIRYFDSVTQVGEFLRDLAFKQGGTTARNAINKLANEEGLALYGWVLNGETSSEHWTGRAFNFLLERANLDDFERRLLQGIHAYMYEGDTSAETLRDLFVNGPLAVD